MAFYHISEVSGLNKTLGECQRKNLILQEEVEHLRLKSDAAALEAKQLQASLLRENELQNKCNELQKKMQGKNMVLIFEKVKNSIF